MASDVQLDSVMLDASMFTRRNHCEAVTKSDRSEYFVSESLHEIMYKKQDQENVTKVLNHFRAPSSWHTPLPSEKYQLEFREKLKPYRFKSEFVKDVYSKYLDSPLPGNVKQIVLDEWSFLNEHSSILLASKHFAYYLFDWGVAFLNATNQFYDVKHVLLQPVRGMKFFLGVAVSVGGILVIKHPKLRKKIAVGGIAVALFDP